MSTPNEKRWVSKLAALDANLLVALDAPKSNVTHAAKRPHSKSDCRASGWAKRASRWRHCLDYRAVAPSR